MYDLCQHLGSLRSLWEAPETKTLGWGGSECPPVQSRVKTLLVICDKDITITQSIMAQFDNNNNVPGRGAATWIG